MRPARASGAGDEARYHSAMVMTPATAAELRDLLANVLAEPA
jgi:hypothetical protein